MFYLLSGRDRTELWQTDRAIGDYEVIRTVCLFVCTSKQKQCGILLAQLARCSCCLLPVSVYVSVYLYAPEILFAPLMRALVRSFGSLARSLARPMTMLDLRYF